MFPLQEDVFDRMLEVFLCFNLLGEKHNCPEPDEGLVILCILCAVTDTSAEDHVRE